MTRTRLCLSGLILLFLGRPTEPWFPIVVIGHPELSPNFPAGSGTTQGTVHVVAQRELVETETESRDTQDRGALEEIFNAHQIHFRTIQFHWTREIKVLTGMRHSLRRNIEESVLWSNGKYRYTANLEHEVEPGSWSKLTEIEVFNGLNYRSFSHWIDQGSRAGRISNQPRRISVGTLNNVATTSPIDTLLALANAPRVSGEEVSANYKIRRSETNEELLLIETNPGPTPHLSKEIVYYLNPDSGYAINSILIRIPNLYKTEIEVLSSRVVDGIRIPSKMEIRNFVPEKILQDLQVKKAIEPDTEGPQDTVQEKLLQNLQLSDTLQADPEGFVLNAIHSINVSDVLINEPVEDSVFDFEFPEGTTVEDELARKTYTITQ